MHRGQSELCSPSRNVELVCSHVFYLWMRILTVAQVEDVASV